MPMLKRNPGNPMRPLPWLEPHQGFPPLASAWGSNDPAPGLLAAGETLDVPTLLEAYSHGIFPWFSAGQPVLWWSPNPRMVLETRNFKLHRSLRKTLTRFSHEPHCEIKFDTAFERVISACAGKKRTGQSGTWIVADMERAYLDLHHAGHAHSVETWINGELAGGLYCVNLGKMVFGESMFANQTDASKIALSALVAFCLANDIPMVDCQQNTGHLASLGAGEISRSAFEIHVHQAVQKTAPIWHFESSYWNQVMTGSAVDRSATS